jgi:hypothetical protein
MAEHVDRRTSDMGQHDLDFKMRQTDRWTKLD